MNPSYLSIELPKAIAMKRFKAWMGLEEIDTPKKVKFSNAVDEATDGDNWRGISVFIYESDNKTIFEDMTGFLSSFSAEKWTEFALNENMEFIGYNDAVPYGQIIIIRKGKILKDFLHDQQDPSENRNIGKFEFEESRELKTWVDAASYVDSAMKKIDLPEEGDLWIFENPYT